MAEKTKKNIEEISKKLNVLLSLILRDLIQDKDFSTRKKRKQDVSKFVYYLADFGLDAKDIAKILGAPIQSVRTLLTPKRRK